MCCQFKQDSHSAWPCVRLQHARCVVKQNVLVHALFLSERFVLDAVLCRNNPSRFVCVCVCDLCAVCVCACCVLCVCVCVCDEIGEHREHEMPNVLECECG